MFLIFRGLSSLCFLPPHYYATTVIQNDPFARYSILIIMICSLAWNNLAFAWPQFIAPGTWVVPSQVVYLASTLDGFGMTSGSLVVLGRTSGLHALVDYPFYAPPLVAALYSAYEHWLVVNSQGAHCPRFTGLSGGTLVKLHYPFQVHVCRSSAVALAVITSAYHCISMGRHKDVVVMAVFMIIAFGTYMTNGYDKDFTCFRVWIWHGCCSVFIGYLYLTMSLLGA